MGKIVIVGGGFGGVRAALDLAEGLGDGADITLIDRNGYHLFLPLLYEAASAYGLPRDPYAVRLRKTVAIPYADIFENTGVQFVQAEVVGINLADRVVATAGNTIYPYDYLILALGSEAADFGIPGVRDYAHSFKTIEDAIIINRKLADLFRQACPPDRQAAGGLLVPPIRILIGGAGFTGIELAAEIACCAKNLAREHGLKGTSCVTTLVEATPKILPNISDRERSLIARRLTRLGVGLMANAPIEEVGMDFIRLKSGQMLRGHLIVWTAGTRPHGLLQRIPGLSLVSSGKIAVDEHLNTVGDPRVFAVGDNVEFIDHRTQKPEPALGYVARDHGSIAARNIIRSIQGKELRNHKPWYGAWIAPLGGKYAVAHLGQGMTISGFSGWVVRALVDLRYFLSILPWRKALRLFRTDMSVFTKNDSI